MKKLEERIAEIEKSAKEFDMNDVFTNLQTKELRDAFDAGSRLSKTVTSKNCLKVIQEIQEKLKYSESIQLNHYTAAKEFEKGYLKLEKENDELRQTKDLLEMDLTAAQEIMIDLKKESEWRPIESAPKDGTQILLYVGNDPKFMNVTVGCYWRGWVTKTIEPDFGHYALSQLDQPTHWKPIDLPNPPKIINK